MRQLPGSVGRASAPAIADAAGRKGRSRSASTRLLVTGGLGYIGSHTCVALAEAGYDIVILDSLANSRISVLDRVHELTGKEMPFFRADVRGRTALDEVFAAHSFDAVLHFAGLKAVTESVARPALYREVNVGGSRNVFEAKRTRCSP